MASASGFISMMELRAGPRLSTSSMRAEYFSTSDRAVNLPDFIPSCSSAIVISSSSKGLTSRFGPEHALPPEVDGAADDAAARAAPSAGYSAEAAPVASADCRKERRERVPSESRLRRDISRVSLRLGDRTETASYSELTAAIHGKNDSRKFSLRASRLFFAPFAVLAFDFSF